MGHFDNRLCTAEDKLNILFNKSMDILCIVDADDNKILDINETVNRVLGYSRESLIGEQFNSLFLESHKTQIDEDDKFIIRDSVIELHDCQCKDGSILPVDMTITPIPWENKNAFLATLRDSSERIEAEIKLAAEKERLAVTLASIGDGVIAIDCDKKIVLLNSVAEQMTGWTLKESESQPLEIVLQCCNEQTKRDFEIPLQCVFQKKVIETFGEHTLLRSKNLSEHPIVGSISPILLPSQEMIGIVLVFRDISHEREVERLKADFVSSVTHELRTPLTAIKGFISTINRDPMMPNETRQEFLNIIDRDADRLSSLVDDLLEISRIESGALKLDLEPVSIRQLIFTILDALNPVIDAKQIELLTDIPDKIPLLSGDENRLQSVFINLIDNAVKFSPVKSRLKISISISKQKEMSIGIQDNGIGIPPQDIPRIFDRFYRVNRPGKEIRGTG